MSGCFHCGLPVPPGGRYRVLALGAERELCCAGCEAVARTIVAGGMQAYYETRTAPAAPFVEEPAERNYGAETEGTQASLILERVRCAACLWLIERTLRRLPGVARADVNYATQRAQVSWDPARLRLPQIVAALRAVGYDASPYEPRRREQAERRERRTALARLFVAGFGAMQVMMYAFPAYVDAGGLSPDAAALMRWASLALTVPVLAFSCAPFFAGAWQELRLRRIGLDVPIALGLAAGFAASAWATVSGGGEVYFDSISMLAFLLLGARYVEAAARRRAARALDPLLAWDAQRKLAAGEDVRIAPGERIPADGVVIEGSSQADESLLTGESRPVAKGPGDELVGGAVNLDQPLLMRVTRVGADTRAAAIARLAERGAASKPRLVAAAERIARHLTAAIVVTAAAAALYWSDPWVAVAVLVVACPCALALAAPVVLTRAGAELLRRGVLLARAGALQALERATDVVLDKTGTLTAGRMSIARAVALGGLDVQACMRLAAALEAAVRHPIAGAFAAWSSEAIAVHGIRHAPGQGVEGIAAGRRVRIGNEEFCGELCGKPGPAAGPAAPERTGVFLADERGWLALIELEDELRPEAQALVDELRRLGIVVHLASGDSAHAVAAAAARLAIERFASRMSPQDKYDYVERLQGAGRVVAMIGDGVNDAPVLARADVSFAMGAGADLAALHSDLILTGNSLRGIAAAMALAGSAMRLVRRNIGWALAYNAFALPLAALGAIGPWEAALAMAASSAAVLLNALRPLAPDAKWKASTSSFRSRSLSYS